MSQRRGEVQGLSSRELQHVDVRKMREKETGKESSELGGKPRQWHPGRSRKDVYEEEGSITWSVAAEEGTDN